MAEATTSNSTPQNPHVMGSVTQDGFTVESNYETTEQLREGLAETTPTSGDTPTESAEHTEIEAKAEPPTPKARNRREDPRAAVQSAIAKQREAERLAQETADKLTAVETELAELRKKPAAAPPAPTGAPIPTPASREAIPPSIGVPGAAPPVSEADYNRYLSMPDAPDIEKFTSIPAYNFAVADFVAKTRFNELMAQHEQATETRQRAAQFSERVTAEIAKDPAFADKLKATPVDTRIIPFLHRHPQGQDVMVYLVEHPDIAQALTSLHPVEQIGRIGEIVGTMKAQSAAAIPPAASARPAISQAKPVTKRVNGQPPAATDEAPGDDASEAEHEAYWGPRRAALRHRRHR